MAVSKEALRAQLEGAMEDVALAMSESVSFQGAPQGRIQREFSASK